MASGWWDNNGAISGCVAAYRAIGADSLAASKSNLFNPGTHDLSTTLTEPSWTAAGGWAFNGTTQGWKVSSSTLLNGITGWTVILRGSITAGAKRGLFGFGRDGASSLLFIEHDRWFSRISSSVSISYTATTGSDTTWAYKADSSSCKVYAGGSEVASGGGISGTFGTNAGALSVFHSHDGTGGAPNYMLGSGLAVAIYSAALSAADIATVSAAMAALTAASGQPAALRGVFVPGMMTGGRRIIRAGWGG